MTAPIEVREPDIDEVVDEDRPWVVIVWNDPINLMSYVTFVFRKLFGYSEEKATKLACKELLKHIVTISPQGQGANPDQVASALPSEDIAGCVAASAWKWRDWLPWKLSLSSSSANCGLPSALPAAVV